MYILFNDDNLQNTNMISRWIIAVTAIILLSGCSVFTAVNRVPQDFIVEQDITSVWNRLNAIKTHDYYVWYQGGTDKLTQEEQLKLQGWIDAEQPAMISLRGTGGAEHYRTLAEQRVFGVISYIQAQNAGIEMIKLEYDPSIRGGRVLITKIPAALAAEIRSSAPILVIKSG